MLSPDYLESCTDEILAVYEQLQSDLLADMARRIVRMGKVSESTLYQMQVYEEAGGVYDHALEKIAGMNGGSEDALKRLFEDAGSHALLYDDRIYTAAGLSPVPLALSPDLLQILRAGLQKTKGSLRNMTMTTATATQQRFIEALNRAYYQASSGGMGHRETVRRVVKDLAQEGIKTIHYPTGHSDKVDVAVRRAVLTGVNQTALSLQLSRAEEMGSDLVETTAHGGARPSHAEWQGQIFSRSGKSKEYPEFAGATGYGTGGGLGGWNCRHSFFPYFEGLSTPAYQREDLLELEKPRYSYRGKDYTAYDASQMQRKMERKIREDKRILAAYRAGEKEDPEGETGAQLRVAFESQAVRLKQREKQLASFIKETGFQRQKEREQVFGFGRSEAMKAVWANRRRGKEK